MNELIKSKIIVITIFTILLVATSIVSYNLGKNSNITSENHNLQSDVINDSENSIDFWKEKNNNEVIDKKVNEIAVSLDNWQDYFEFMTIPEWDYNAFNEVDGLALKLVLHLKDKWQSKIVNGNSHNVAFEVKGTKILKKVSIDYKNKTYKILENDEENGTYEVITNAYNGSTSDVQIFWCYEGYLIKGIPNIEILENPQVTRVNGHLYLYD